MTETYYYLWEFFTSIAILALIAIYVIYDRKQARNKMPEEAPVPPNIPSTEVQVKNKPRRKKSRE